MKSKYLDNGLGLLMCAVLMPWAAKADWRMYTLTDIRRDLPSVLRRVVSGAAILIVAFDKKKKHLPKSEPRER